MKSLHSLPSPFFTFLFFPHFLNQVFLCGPGYPGTCDSPTSASQGTDSMSAPLLFCFWDRVSACNSGYPGIRCVELMWDQAGLKLTDIYPPAFAFQVLELKVCFITPGYFAGFVETSGLCCGTLCHRIYPAFTICESEGKVQMTSFPLPFLLVFTVCWVLVFTQGIHWTSKSFAFNWGVTPSIPILHSSHLMTGNFFVDYSVEIFFSPSYKLFQSLKLYCTLKTAGFIPGAGFPLDFCSWYSVHRCCLWRLCTGLLSTQIPAGAAHTEPKWALKNPTCHR